MLYALVVLIGALTLYVFVLVEEDRQHNFISSNITWDRYLKFCGYEAYKKSPRSAKLSFNQKFFRRGVNWDGYVVRVNYNDDNPMSMSYHSASLIVKMDHDDWPDEL